MAWKYETKTLEEVYNILNNVEYIHTDYEILKNIAEKAYKVALFFEENGMNKEFIINYLDDKLEYGSLCKYGLTSSVLYPDNIDIDKRIYSCSHKEFLNTLNVTKLYWNREIEGSDINEVQKAKVKKIVRIYNELQSLALSYNDLNKH